MSETTSASWARRHRRWILAAILVLLVAIVVAAPSYNDAQTARSAAAFRAAVAEDGSTRFTIAALLDLGFALSYGLLALALAGADRASRVGARVLGVGAAADVVENGFVLAGVVRSSDLTDGGVALMRAFGALKWLGVIVGAVLLVAGRIAARR